MSRPGRAPTSTSSATCRSRTLLDAEQAGAPGGTSGGDGPAGDEAETSLAGIDAIASEVLSHAAPLRMGVAGTVSEREAVYRLRYETVIEQGWARPEDYPDGLERDAHDDEAIHLVAWDGSALAGTARMVLPSPNRDLPLEAAYEIRIEPVGRVVDGGRLIVAGDRRGEAAHKVVACLFCRFWLETRERGFNRIAAVAPAKVIDFYRRLGLEVTVLGEPRDYWGAERYPILLAGTEGVFPGMRAAGPGG